MQLSRLVGQEIFSTRCYWGNSILTCLVYLSTNPVKYQWIKNTKIVIHFVLDRVVTREISFLHVSSSLQYTGILTKGIPYSLFSKFRSNLST